MKSLVNKRTALILLVSLVANSPVVNIAIAAAKKNNDPTQKYQCQLISRGEAIKQAKSRLKGKVVGVQLSERNKRSVYRVRILVDNKRIKTISIQACR